MNTTYWSNYNYTLRHGLTEIKPCRHVHVHGIQVMLNYIRSFVYCATHVTLSLSIQQFIL